MMWHKDSTKCHKKEMAMFRFQRMFTNFVNALTFLWLGTDVQLCHEVFSIE